MMRYIRRIGVACWLMVLISGSSSMATAQGVDANTYESPTFGYTLSWDREWTVDRDESEGDYDLLKLDSDNSSLWFEGQFDFQGDPGACLQDAIESVSREIGVSDVEPMQRNGKVIEASSSLVAYAALTFTLTGEDGEALEGAVYVECRTLIRGEAVLEITHITAEEFFDEEHASVVAILKSLHMPSVSSTDEQRQPRRESRDEDAPRGDTDELVASMEDSSESIDAFWAETFDEIGLDYESPEVVFYDRPVESGCGGAAPMEVGPHYCYVDSTIYIDTVFMEELILPYGEFALAFVIAHEWGHHLQNELDVTQCQIQQCLGGYTSLETELQADCIAGMWTRYADDAELLSYGDAESAVRVLAELVGDPEGTSVDDPALHGPGSLRAYWFLRGYYEGAAACFADGSE